MKIHRVRAQLRAVAAVLAFACVAAPLTMAAAGAAASSSSTRTLAAASIRGVVNVNAASLEQLQMLPGVGEARARAIVEARKQRGGFKSVDELVEVKGIGDALLERLRAYLRTEGKTTLASTE